MKDPKTGIHEATVIIPWWLDCRARWTQKQIKLIHHDAKRLMAKMQPLPTVEHLSRDAE